MLEVSSTVLNLTVSGAHYLAPLAPKGIALRKMFDLIPPALGSAKFLLSFTKEAGVVHLLTIRKVSEVFKSQVNTNSRSLMVSGYKGGCFNREDHEPLLQAFSFDGYGLDLANHFTVQLDPEGANPREGQLIVLPNRATSCEAQPPWVKVIEL